MEAIGQLTGGIAHDFNNMLAVVISSFELTKRRLARGEADFTKFIEPGVDAARRAADLTKRLLAFARQQPLSPQAADVNKCLLTLSEILQRTVGENIRFETVLAGGLWKAHVDLSALDNAIVNLAANARDAMPDGGKLTIETSNAHLDEAYSASHAEVIAGQYILIAITDNGAGMSPAAINKAFDPFYTTKPDGKGTGLGLAQVYGFIKQSGGHAKIYSEPGHGTTVKLYLPRYTGSEDSTQAPEAVRSAPLGTAQETILLVEDDERVRLLSIASVRELGYTVLEADGAVKALRLLDAHPEIALLFTDIVMPDVNGRKLADEARRRRPKLKVLFTTGFTRNAIIHNGMLDRGVNFIAKPYNLVDLASKLRQILDDPP
jgi:CheY-like chemotaxis protein